MSKSRRANSAVSRAAAAAPSQSDSRPVGPVAGIPPKVVDARSSLKNADDFRRRLHDDLAVTQTLDDDGIARMVFGVPGQYGAEFKPDGKWTMVHNGLRNSGKYPSGVGHFSATLNSLYQRLTKEAAE